MGRTRANMPTKQAKFHVKPSADAMCSAFLDEALSKRFHQQVGDRNLRAGTWTDSQTPQRQSSWSFPTSTGTYALTGASETKVNEVTRYSNATFTTRVTLGGCQIFQNTTATTVVSVAPGPRGGAVITATITVEYKKNDFAKGPVERSALDGFMTACVKWVQCAERAAPAIYAAQQRLAAEKQQAMGATTALQAAKETTQECSTVRNTTDVARRKRDSSAIESPIAAEAGTSCGLQNEVVLKARRVDDTSASTTSTLRKLNKELCKAQQELLACPRRVRRDSGTPERRRVDTIQRFIKVAARGNAKQHEQWIDLVSKLHDAGGKVSVPAVPRVSSLDMLSEQRHPEKSRSARAEAERQLMQSPRTGNVPQRSQQPRRARAPTRRRPLAEYDNSLSKGIDICREAVREVILVGTGSPRQNVPTCPQKRHAPTVPVLKVPRSGSCTRAARVTRKRSLQSPRHLGLASVLLL